MATVLDIVRAAHSKIGVRFRADDLESDYASAGVDAFNEMLHGWKLRGVDVFHSDLELTDDFPLGDEYREGTIYLLASRLSPEYQFPAGFDADDWFRTFQAAYMTISKVAMPGPLQRMPSQYWHTPATRGEDF